MRSGFSRLYWHGSEFDYATLLGIVCAFGLVLLAILLGGSLWSFFDLKSILIVGGGTIGATLITFPLEDFQRTTTVLRTALFPDNYSARRRLDTILEMSKVARSEGEISLENYLRHEQDPFLRKGMELVIDAVPPQEARRIMEIEIASLEDRHRRGAQLFQTMGSVAPAMGLVGTTIGLVRMLENLEDPAAMGPSMATAILTTFYGAMIAYVICLPIAGKLRARSEEEQLLKQLTIEGIVCVAEGLNPRIIEARLLSFLPPEERHSRYN